MPEDVNSMCGGCYSVVCLPHISIASGRTVCRIVFSARELPNDVESLGCMGKRASSVGVR